jgi:hypothetical protein
VLASLLVSVLMVGFKLNSAKEIVQIIERRQELQMNLSMVRRLLEIENTKAWIKDVAHDTKQREDRIAELESASGHVYDLLEDALIAKGDAMFAVFEASSAGAKQLKHSALIMYSHMKLDEASGLLYGRAAAMIRATPQEIVANFLVSVDSRFTQSTIDPTVFIRSDVVERVNSHQTVVFNRLKVGPGLLHRTFLNSIVAKRVADDPPTYVVVGLPIAQHDKITAKDEKGAVRAENCRAFRLTEVAEGITKMEYTCSLNLGGSIPQAITNKVAVPGQQHGAPVASCFRSGLAGLLFACLCTVRPSYRLFTPAWPVCLAGLLLACLCTVRPSHRLFARVWPFCSAHARHLLAGRLRANRCFCGSLQSRRRCSDTFSRFGRSKSATPRTAGSSDTCCTIWSAANRRIWRVRSASLRTTQRCSAVAGLHTSATCSRVCLAPMCNASLTTVPLLFPLHRSQPESQGSTPHR